MYIETRRLFLCVPTTDDVPALFQFMGDPAATPFTQTERSLQSCQKTVMCAEAARFGWGGLYVDQDDPRWGPELIYRFEPTAWGQGYGTELGIAAIDLADDLHLRELAAFAHPQNLASLKIIEKAVFTKIGYVADIDRIFFRANIAPDIE